MKLSVIFLTSALMFFGFTAPDDAWAQGKVLLGQRHFSDVSEKDTIPVGKRRGSFTGVRVKVIGAPVEFKRVVIHFENGSKQVFEKNRLLGKGDQTRVIDLEGGARFIDRVVFSYEARTRGWKGAEIKLFGVR